MNIYTGLLFLHGHIADPGVFAETPDYGPSYGNRVANARVLRERWETDPPEVDGDERRDPASSRAA